MENKSNSLSRIKSQQREKVLRFSIRKYSFGAASVAVAALMFLGARVASADSVIEANSQPTTDVVKQKEKDKPLVEIQQPTDIKVEVAQNPSEKKTTTNDENVVKVVDKAKLKKVVEELNATFSSKSNLDNSVISPIKDRVQKGQALLESDTATQKDVDELLSLLESDLTVLSNATKESSTVQETTTENKTEIKDNKTASELSEADKTISDKKESLKLSAEQLQAAVLELPEHESTKEVFEKANELLGLAQGVIQSTTISPNDIEDLTKRVKRMFNSVKISTLRLTSGKNDPRNGQSMGEGTQFRADGQISSGALANIKYFASVDPNMPGNNGRRTRNDEPEFTRNKTDIKAYYVKDSEGQWIVYDVFFNNDGKKMTVNSYQQEYYFQGPFNIMDLNSNGTYKSNTIKDLSFTRYAPKNPDSGKKLSDGFEAFNQYGNTAYISNFAGQNYNIFNNDRRTIYDPSSGVTRDNQRWDVFKNNQNDPTLNILTKNKNNSYPSWSYYLGIKAGSESTNYAVHMHAKIKIRDNVTPQEAAQYGRVYAASTTHGSTTNQSYIMGTLGTSLTPRDTTPPTITANNATVTSREQITPIPVTAVDNRGGVGMRDNNPIEVTGLPAGLTYANNRITGTPTGKPGNSTVTIKAYDKNGNKAEKTITITVKDQASKYNPTGGTLTVNQGQSITDDAVKAKVKNYAPGTLTVVSKPSTAKPGNVGNAVVKVTYPDGSSENVNVPVTVLEAPDTQAPTLAITPTNQTVVEGESVTFTVTARDNKIVNLDNSDFLTKYGSRLVNAKATATNVKDTDTEKIRTITITTTAEDVGKTNTITFNAKDNANHRATPVSFTFTVTKRDNVPPTITAGDATVTSREQITPISVTAVDNPGGVGLRNNNPIEVSGLPAGLTYANNRITGTPTGTAGNSTVTIKAHDKNGNTATKTITITVRSQADVHNPTGETLTVNQGQTISDDAVKTKVKNFAPGTLTVESKPTSTARAGSAGNAVVKVTYPDGSHDTVTVPVTVKDVTGPTITAEEITVTKNEEITPIPITAEDNAGGVGMRETNPITVSNLPSGLTFKDGKITGTTSARKGFYTLTITAYDKNNTPSTKKVRINVQEQADKYTPTATELTVNQNEDITIEKLTPKVNNPGAGTLSLVSKPSTTTAGKAGNAVVKVTYSDGSHDLVNVPITVKDVTGPTITANNATVTNREDITPISVTAKDNTGGVGMRDTNPIVVTGLPAGLTYANGQITGKPTGTAGESTVTITAYDKNDNPSTTTIKITVQSQADAHNPRGERLTVDQNHVIEDSEVIAKVKDYAPATQLTVKSKPTTENVGDVADAVVTVTYPDGSSEDVNVPVTVRDVSVPDTEGPTITANGATVTKNEPIDPISVTAEDNPGGVGLRDDNPIVVEGLPNGLTFKDEKITGTPTAPAGDYPVTITAYDKKGNSTTTTITIKVQEQKEKYAPKGEGLTVNQGHEITDDEVKAKVKDFAPGTLTVTSKPSTATTGNVGNAVVTVTYPDGSSETVDVPVTVKDVTGPTITADGATVTRNEPITPIPVKVVDNEGGRGLREDNPVEVTGLPDGLTYANGEITGTPAKTAEKGGYTVTINATDKDGNSTEKQITITVQTQADKYTPKYDGGEGKPGAKVEVPVKEEAGKTIPEGTKFESLTPGITVDDKGKVTVTIPEDKKPGDEIPGTIKVTYPDGSKEEVPVKVTVTTSDRDIYTPKYDDGEGKPGAKVEVPVKEEAGKTIPEGTKFESLTPGITVDKDGKVIVTIPEGAKPGDKITGEITVTYPDGSKDIVPVEVTVTNKDKDIYTPEYDKGNGKPGGTVELPLKEKAGKKIPEGTTFQSDNPGITVDKDGKVIVTIPEGAKPGDKITGEITVTYPDGTKDIVPVEVIVTNKDKDIYTPEYDKGNGKPETKVEIPAKEDQTPKEDKTPAQEPQKPSGETPSTTGEPVQQTQDTNQNILPNTGTADGLGIFSAAAASILSGLGLVVFGKKEDEESENN